VRGGGGRVIHERGGEPGSPGADVEGVSPFGPGADATRSEPVRPPCGWAHLVPVETLEGWARLVPMQMWKGRACPVPGADRARAEPCSWCRSGTGRGEPIQSPGWVHSVPGVGEPMQRSGWRTGWRRAAAAARCGARAAGVLWVLTGVLPYRVAASGRSSAVRSAGSAEIPNDTAVHVEYLPHKPTHASAHARTHTLAHTWVGRAGQGRDARGNHRQRRVPAVRVDDVEPINRYSRYRRRTTWNA